MKIGILTLHRSVNDGAALQAYCLQELLKTTMPQARVELVDYRPWLLERIEYRRLIRRRPPFLNQRQWAKRRSIYAFINRYCALSSTRCTADDLDKARNFIVSQRYDAIVVGSDIVWQVRERGSAAPLAPNIYFLPDVQGLTKIAFAASADRSERSLFGQSDRRDQLLRSVQDFDFISVRDEATRLLLLELGLTESQFSYMPDPTLLWDLSSIAETPVGFDKSKGPLVGVAVSGMFPKEQLTQLLSARGYQVVNPLGADVQDQFSPPSSCSLKQRLGIYSCLDLMITDRFHGSIFTLKLSDAPVVFVEEASKYPESLSKGRDLFRRLDLEEMVWRYKGEEVPEDLLNPYITIWKDLYPDVKQGLASMKHSAENGLRQIREILGQRQT